MAVGVVSTLAVLIHTFGATIISAAASILIGLSPIGGFAIFAWGMHDIWRRQDYSRRAEILYTLVFLLPFVGLIVYLTLADRWDAVQKMGGLRG